MVSLRCYHSDTHTHVEDVSHVVSSLFIRLGWHQRTQQVGLPVGVVTVGVMIGGAMTVGAMTVEVLTVGSMGRPRKIEGSGITHGIVDY